MRLLVVDDDPEIRHVVRVALEAAGFEVELATDGAAAIDRARARPPDGIVLDLLLPDVGGEAAYDRLRSLPGMADVPVVFLTGKAGRERRATLLEKGAAGVIDKPFDPLTLAEEIGRLTGRPAGGS